MNLVGALVGILLLAIMVAIGYEVSQLVIELNTPALQSSSATQFTLPKEPMPEVTLRWNHFPLTVYIDTDFIKQNPGYVNDFRQALELWESSTNNLISFLVVSSSDADISTEWVPNLKEKSLDTLGNTDIKFVNASGYGLIQNADIQLLTKTNSKDLSELDMTNLALHEIGHAIGLHHSDNENDIMYPSLTIPSKEIKKISNEEIQKLQEIYSVKSKPDLRIVEVNVSKTMVKRFAKTFYLVNISMVMENIGLTDADASQMKINADSNKVKQEVLPALPIGNKLSIIIGNVLVENDFGTIEIILDPDSAIEELNEGNNVVVLNVS